jgi:hypothetical protein
MRWRMRQRRIDIYDTRRNLIRFPQQSIGKFSHGRDARAYIAGVKKASDFVSTIRWRPMAGE